MWLVYFSMHKTQNKSLPSTSDEGAYLQATKMAL